MKIIFIISYFLLSFVAGMAQVGINTENPRGVFHLDGNGNTDAFNIVDDDVVVTDDGKIGLGTTTPTASLDVRGDFRYVDGNQNDGYMLQTDAEGNAKWVTQSLRNMILPNEAIDNGGNLNMEGMTISTTPSVMQYMNTSITLPPGAWQVYFNATFSTTNTAPLNIWWDLSTSSTIDQRVGRVLSFPTGGGTSGANTRSYTPVTAIYFVNNTETATYYIWAGASNVSVPLVYSGEARMWAIPLYY